MSTNESSNGNPSDPNAVMMHELAALRNDWWWLLVLGIGLIVLGTVAISATPFVTVVTVVFFGVLLLIGGVAQIVAAFWEGKWSGLLLHLLVGILYVVIGFLITESPVESAAGLTLVIAAFLMVGGIFRIVAALALRFHNWGWTLLSGFISLMLGVLIFKQWPASGLVVIGLFIGIEMLFNGWTWVMLSLDIRRLPVEEESAESA